jgi:hypothetical protein
MCALDPQTTSLLAPLAQATVIAVPFIFRDRIVAGIRRARGIAPDPMASDSGEDCDTPADDPSDRAEPPGAVRP